MHIRKVHSIQHYFTYYEIATLPVLLALYKIIRKMLDSWPQSYIQMIYFFKPRLPQLLLSQIIQPKIIITNIISLARGIENQYQLIHDPAIQWLESGNQ